MINERQIAGRPIPFDEAYGDTQFMQRVAQTTGHPLDPGVIRVACGVVDEVIKDRSREVGCDRFCVPDCQLIRMVLVRRARQPGKQLRNGRL